MSVYRLLYVSGSSRRLGADDIASILVTSRRNNERRQITGMLLYADGAFLQVLEGDEKVLRALVTKIRADDRHRNIMVLYENHAEHRSFPDWAMGFRELDPKDARDGRIFAATREAIAARIDPSARDELVDMVMAFGRDFIG